MKRLLSLIIAFALLLSTFVPYCFSDYSSQPRTFWDKFLYKTCELGSSLSAGVDVDGFTVSVPVGSLNGWFNSHLSSEICASSSDNLHHADSIKPGSFSIGSDGKGKALCTCKYCGHDFVYRSDDLQQDYQTYLHDNNLDGDTYISPSNPSDDSFTMRVPATYFGNNHIQYPTAYGRLSFYNDAIYNYGLDSNFVVTRRRTSSYNYLRGYGPRGPNPDIYWGSWVICYVFNSPVSGSVSVSSPSLLDFYALDASGSRVNHPYDNSELSLSGIVHSDGSTSMTVVEGVNVLYAYFGGFSPDTGLEASITPFVINITPSSDYSAPSVPQNVTINNNTYPVTSINFDTRTVITEGDTKIEYGDTEIKIYEGDTVIQTINYIIENDDPGTDSGNGDDSSTSQGGGTVDPGDSSGSGGSGCCEQCALLLRQVNSYLLQIQTLVDQINDKLGPESDNYMEGIYNLLVEINTALDNLPTEPHKDYEAKLTIISNQLANIWGDLDTIKTSLSAVQTNTATTNQKLDTVHADLQAVLAELQTQRGILNQILSVLRDMLGHITSIDSNVEELASEEDSQNFFDSFILKFHFIGDIFSIIRQLFADITNDAATVTFVDNGDLPIGDLTSQHFPVSGSPVPVGTAPQVLIKFPSDTYHGADLSGYSAIDMSWYAPYKSRVDALISGFLWIGYLWLLFKRAPGIVRGAAMIEETNYKIEDWKNGG